MLRWAWSLLALVACRAPTDEAAPTQAVAPAARPPVFIRAPSTFERDMAASEEAAVEGVQKGPAKRLCAGLLARDSAKLSAELTGDFLGRWVGDRGPVTSPADEPVAVSVWAASQAELSAEAFVARLLRDVSGLSVAERCALKPFNFKLATDGSWAWARLHFELAGRDGEGRGLVRRTDWEVELRWVGDAWRFHRVGSGDLTEVVGHAPPFSDVSAATGVGFRFGPVAEENRQDLVDFGARDGIGGLAVLDWDADGFDDILAWHRLRALTLFRNDGRGGFVARHGLVPSADVGYFMLTADLDGDGAVELVSSEAHCVDGVMRFPVFTRRGTALLPVKGGLSIRRDCGEVRGADLQEANPIIFQHVAAHDIDGDGDLDLYLSGYAGRHSRRERFNFFDATDGVTDLLFVNQGGLRFVEEGRKRGIEGTRWTYLAAFFDVDSDGDDDLYAANDYGPNSLYLNDGAGRFALQPKSLWTPNSQSMGITVADLDGDLDFDVYVSNMYSKAGNRLVPLAQGALSPATYEALLGSAAGNWLFERRGAGDYREVAHDWGVAEAGWAWGQAAFDFDNDADRDLYVVNGMTSHSRYKDDDY